MERLETALMTVIWHTVLDRCNATSVSLQKADIPCDCRETIPITDNVCGASRETIDDMEIKAISFADKLNISKWGQLKTA